MRAPGELAEADGSEEVLESGERTGREDVHFAPDVVCNMDPKAAAGMIGLDQFSKTVRRRLSYDYSPSSFMAYCAVEGIDLREYGFGLEAGSKRRMSQVEKVRSMYRPIESVSAKKSSNG